MISKEKTAEIREIAREVRMDIVKMLAKAGSGHTGGSLSSVEIITTLYFAKLRHDPKKPDWPDRDRFIISKGHGVPTLYVILAKRGYFDSSHFDTLRSFGSILQGHPYCRATPGLEVCSGSLGQGLSQANGIALAGRLDNKGYRVYVLLGDGEIQEGLVWEAAMTAAHYKIDNLCAILDYNGLQIDGPVDKVMGIEPVAKKWEAFGWHVQDIDGHNCPEILNALDQAEAIKGKPTIIIAHTTKGKGISFMENKVKYHGVSPTKDELETALHELDSH